MTRVITFEEAASAARGQFLRTHHVDMAGLCTELAVARATLYRVVGSRDRLLGHVIAELGDQTMAQVMAQAAEEHPPGVERIIRAAYLMNAAVKDFAPIRGLIEIDPETAFRVLFTVKGGVHENAVSQWTKVLGQAQEEAGLVFPRDVARTAYMFVRIGESAIFADLLSSREPDLELAADLQRALLTMG